MGRTHINIESPSGTSVNIIPGFIGVPEKNAEMKLVAASSTWRFLCFVFYPDVCHLTDTGAEVFCTIESSILSFFQAPPVRSLKWVDYPQSANVQRGVAIAVCCGYPW